MRSRSTSTKFWLGVPVYLFFSSVLLWLAHMLDRYAYEHWVALDVLDNDRGRLFRIAGYLPTWLFVAFGMFFAGSRNGREPVNHRARLNGIKVFAAATAGGILAEIAKLLIRRERPEIHLGRYFFRPWSWSLSTANLSMPSSHALVAFAAAFMLWRLYPRAWPVWLIIGIGCAAVRVLPRAHFLSDVTLSAILGYAVAWAIFRALNRAR